MSGASNSSIRCGLFEVLIFVAAIVFGTACSICSKTMMNLNGTGSDGVEQPFEKPIFQTLGMFVGMMFGLVMHAFVVILKIPFPGYDHNIASSTDDIKKKYNDYGVFDPSYGLRTEESVEHDKITATEAEALVPKQNGNRHEYSAEETDQLLPKTNRSAHRVPLWMYIFLAIPSIFDLGATALCMMGLRYLDVSIYQLLRGSGIIFVALMKQHILGDALYEFQWLGVFWNAVSVVFVGMAAVLNTSTDDTQDPKDTFLGILLVMTGAFVQALQFVFEEKVMSMDDLAVPPLLLIGMEGLWGTLLCLAVVYPIVYYLPGDDNGSYEDPFNTYDMFINSGTIQFSFFVYFIVIFGYNLFAVLVTYSLNSIWHAILDNFRPITVWCADMLIFYFIAESGDFGEPWMKYSWVQLLGMFVLLYGTAVYNAPNSGSIKLKGEWYSLFIDFSQEYKAIEQEQEDEQMDAEWNLRQMIFQQRKLSSFVTPHSPVGSVRTQSFNSSESFTSDDAEK